jgi:hypothetical protein
MQNEFDKYLDRQPELFFFLMNFRHRVTEKKGQAATRANVFFVGQWPKVAIFGGKKELKSLILTQVLVCHQSSEVPKNFCFPL